MDTRTPMTYEEAKVVSAKYAYLVGMPFGKYIIRDIIEDVSVAPFKTSLQWFFAELFRSYRCMETALSFYHGSEFDVILMTQNSSDRKVVFIQDINTYLEQNEPPRLHHIGPPI